MYIKKTFILIINFNLRVQSYCNILYYIYILHTHIKHNENIYVLCIKNMFYLYVTTYIKHTIYVIFYTYIMHI